MPTRWIGRAGSDALHAGELHPVVEGMRRPISPDAAAGDAAVCGSPVQALAIRGAGRHYVCRYQGEWVMGKGRWLGVCLLGFACVAFARGDLGAVRKQAEASMLVKGSITIAADGSVAGHELERPEKLPPGVVALIGQSLPKWRFEPVMENGEAHETTARMSLLVVANKSDPEHFTVRIRSAQFGDLNPVASDGIGRKKMGGPQYPGEAMAAGVSGTVYLAFRVDREGRVADVAVEQVNLKVVDDERHMAHWREVLAAPVLRAATRWRFTTPTTGRHVDDALWSGRVAVEYHLNPKMPGYGQWVPYIPGPRQHVSWLDADGKDIAGSPDALGSGEIALVGQGPRLLTPLSQG
jgi:hypothetical protein